MIGYLFIDTEFCNFSSLYPLSIGIISEDDNHKYYSEFNDYPLAECSEFVKDEIIPLLSKHGTVAFSYHQNSIKIIDWINQLPYDSIEFVADYQGDLSILYQLIDINKVNLTKKINFRLLQQAIILASQERFIYNHSHMAKALETFSNSVQEILLNNPSQHHAFEDAKANRDGWKMALKYLQSL